MNVTCAIVFVPTQTTAGAFAIAQIAEASSAADSALPVLSWIDCRKRMRGVWVCMRNGFVKERQDVILTGCTWFEQFLEILMNKRSHHDVIGWHAAQGA